jgi:predicted RNA-binding protein Jag
MFAACVVGLVVFGLMAFVLVRAHEKSEFSKAIQRQARREAELMAAIREVLSAEVTDSAVLSEAKRLFASLSPTGRRVFVTGVYDTLLSCLARQPGNTELRVNVLEIGRMAYGSKRPEGVPTIYDEQAVQNDILVRTSGAQPATAQPALQPATLPSPTTYQLHDLDFRPGKTKAVILTVTVLGIVALLVGVVVNSGSADGGKKPSATTEQKPTEKKSGHVEEQTPTSREDETKAVPYRVVGVEDNSIGGRKRTSVKIAVEDKSATPEQVHSTLLKVARSYSGDAVFVFGYWSGDDWRGTYTAGRLEWGKGGQGWSSGDRVPAEGKFDGPPAKLPASEEKIAERKSAPNAEPKAARSDKPQTESKAVQTEKPKTGTNDKSATDVRAKAKELLDAMDVENTVKLRDAMLDYSVHLAARHGIRADATYTEHYEKMVQAAQKRGEYVTASARAALKQGCEQIAKNGLSSPEEDLLLYSAIIKYKEGERLNERQWSIIEKYYTKRLSR